MITIDNMVTASLFVTNEECKMDFNNYVEGNIARAISSRIAEKLMKVDPVISVNEKTEMKEIQKSLFVFTREELRELIWEVHKEAKTNHFPIIMM